VRRAGRGSIVFRKHLRSPAEVRSRQRIFDDFQTRQSGMASHSLPRLPPARIPGMSEPAKRNTWWWLWIPAGMLLAALVLGCCFAPVISVLYSMLTGR
jgi:hypothetical protein